MPFKTVNISLIRKAAIFLLLFLACSLTFPVKESWAADCCTTCNVYTALCATAGCACASSAETVETIPHITEELRLHEEWSYSSSYGTNMYYKAYVTS